MATLTMSLCHISIHGNYAGPSCAAANDHDGDNV